MSLDLTPHFRRFFEAAPDRIHLAAHSHHYWPDASELGQRHAWQDAAVLADRKWSRVFGEIWPIVQKGIAARLNLPDPDTLAFAPNTHEFLKRILSCFPADRPTRILASDAEFHSFSRQIARLEEDGLVEVQRIAAEPFDTFSERLNEAAAAGGHDLVFVSQVFFSSAALGPDVQSLVASVPDPETFIVIDGYHGFMAVPTDLSAVAERVFYISGGYKYAMSGEGCCFMHCPPGFGPRPRDTGWYSAFSALERADGGVPYSTDGMRFVGSTFDPSGLYRMAAVFTWADQIGLTVPAIHAHVLELQDRFVSGIAKAGITALTDARLVTPIGPGVDRGHFLTFETPEAPALYERLLAESIITDVRGDRLRFGLACYHTEASIDHAVERIAEILGASSGQTASV
ncbi:kynureninase/PvdN C-terminal domain-containing protein [Amorphus orientalis]|uniref:Selenocysteine lyase/cysteine desulfurase n=1 Tax=Amorphus orientalis TaxID=649198 RepID=A0AAE3VRF5_9HYPH|nr:aminotransferase [Amorphus orientalis]MDQ0316969.1 selenocysteine lyase/cysteine desulfurase [Amorphus orientalis]